MPQLTQGHQLDPDDPFVSSSSTVAGRPTSGPFTLVLFYFILFYFIFLIFIFIQSSLSHPQTPLGDETFNLAVSPTSSEEEESEVVPLPLADPTTSRQQRAELRASGPAGNRKAHKAEDTITFFNTEGNQRSCKFCL